MKRPKVPPELDRIVDKVLAHRPVRREKSKSEKGGVSSVEQQTLLRELPGSHAEGSEQ